eukprot:CAMPEP_0197675554 /NCGR_PEP_ID=MMETSP1338-20131121/85143_1 /TAXON_ID=43686 ORGANISM="Pelagodinium beii, Strain RCC1491" /NCGR_SAMPLE_ID=MMETSP1338 /ASSEMBLY_ACC=CAM_ASM_000754 /LENGTH=265 /DNA_ID=CAMNT_0043256101 /DNA_START=133 /DNA_END=930 /DNA_ORIENTATION=+
MGRAACLAYLKAGATVIVNSRSKGQLDTLQQDFNNPDNLLCVNNSLRPQSTAEVVSDVMRMTNGRLDHVVAHSGVRFSSHMGSRHLADMGSLDPANPPGGSSGWDLEPHEFCQMASVAPALHFAASQQLIPYLLKNKNASYTFVTGAMNPSMLSSHVSSSAVRGIASNLVTTHMDSPLCVRELCVNLSAGDLKDCLTDSNETEDILRIFRFCGMLGEVLAGMTANRRSGGRIELNSLVDLQRLRNLYPHNEVINGLPSSPYQLPV